MTETMITIDRKQNGILFPLSKLVSRLPVEIAERVRLRDFRMQFGQPLGLTTHEFERRTRSQEGIVLDSEAFLRFAFTDMQIIDGAIEIAVRLKNEESKLLLECVDATHWELASESSEVMTMFEKES